jgi:hypothetical protein
MLYFCDNCGHHKTLDKICEHKFIPILFTIENGNTQLRLVCKNCYYIDPQPKKQTDYPNCKNKKVLNEYKMFINTLEIPYHDFIHNLKKNNPITEKERYSLYLQTESWQKKRLETLKRDKGECQICHGKAEQVHHLTYLHFPNEYMFELVSLCKVCHEKHYHKDSNTSLNKIDQTEF